jgi:hypothetical protein
VTVVLLLTNPNFRFSSLNKNMRAFCRHHVRPSVPDHQRPKFLSDSHKIWYKFLTKLEPVFREEPFSDSDTLLRGLVEVLPTLFTFTGQLG